MAPVELPVLRLGSRWFGSPFTSRLLLFPTVYMSQLASQPTCLYENTTGSDGVVSRRVSGGDVTVGRELRLLSAMEFYRRHASGRASSSALLWLFVRLSHPFRRSCFAHYFDHQGLSHCSSAKNTLRRSMLRVLVCGKMACASHKPGSPRCRC